MDGNPFKVMQDFATIHSMNSTMGNNQALIEHDFFHLEQTTLVAGANKEMGWLFIVIIDNSPIPYV